MTEVLETVIELVSETLQLSYQVDGTTPLVGAMPEFDSMAVVMLLTAIEDHFGITVDDDEIDVSIFETINSLSDFVSIKV